MIPLIATSFSSDARYALNDVVSCTVKKSEAGDYVLKLECPHNGANADMLIAGNYIFAPSSRADSSLQWFVITKITQDIKGLVSVEAKHRTYALSYYPVRAFEKASYTPEEAVAALYTNALRDPAAGSLYLSASDTDSAKEFGFTRPVSFREAVYGNGGLIDVYGGCVLANGNTLVWYKKDSIGENKGVIRYGVNLQKYKRTVDISDTYSHAYVYWVGTGSKTEVPSLVQLGGSETFTAATTLDLSSEFDSKPTEVQMTNRALELASQRELISPEVTLDISFVPLRLTDEYKDLTFLEEVDLFDTVSVDVPMYGITKARVTETNFDVLAETYTRISVGNVDNSFGRLIARIF